MLWDDKIEMCTLGADPNNLKKFQDFVIKHIESFDSQAWTMFLSLITLTFQEVKKQILFYEKIRPQLMNLKEMRNEQLLGHGFFFYLNSFAC